MYKKTDTIGSIIKNDESLASVFAGFGMFCVHCPTAQKETLEEACTVHDINPDELLAALNGKTQA